MLDKADIGESGDGNIAAKKDNGHVLQMIGRKCFTKKLRRARNPAPWKLKLKNAAQKGFYPISTDKRLDSISRHRYLSTLLKRA